MLRAHEHSEDSGDTTVTRPTKPGQPEPGPPEPGRQPSAGTLARTRRGRLRLAVWVVSLAQLMAVLDTTIVNIALPHLQSSLAFPATNLEWVVNAYSLSFGGLLLLGGRAGDILGRRTVFIAGTAVFTAASLLAGLAITQWWMIAARAAQGAGAAFAVPAALALIADTFPGKQERSRAVGLFTAIGAAGGAFGILVGGVLTTFVGWRAVFFVNVPIGGAILLAAPLVLPRSNRCPGRFDLTGALTGIGGVTLLVYTLITGATNAGGQSHWGDPVVIVSGAAALVLLGAFGAREASVPHALVPLRLFAQRPRFGAYAITVCIGTAMLGNLFFLTLFLQRVWGYSPLATAAVYLPPSLMLTAGPQVASRLINRTGPKALIIAGLLIASAGMYGMSLMGEHGSYLTSMLAPTVIGYAGLSLTGVPLITVTLAGIPEGRNGVASGLYTTARQVGGAAGLAVVGTAAWAAWAGVLTAQRPGAAPGGDGAAALLARQAMTAAADRAFLGSAIIVLTAAIIALLTISGRSRTVQPG
jgi:EmrB/QacA subfamily drug resistance transporter